MTPCRGETGAGAGAGARMLRANQRQGGGGQGPRTPGASDPGAAPHPRTPRGARSQEPTWGAECRPAGALPPPGSTASPWGSRAPAEAALTGGAGAAPEGGPQEGRRGSSGSRAHHLTRWQTLWAVFLEDAPQAPPPFWDISPGCTEPSASKSQLGDLSAVPTAGRPGPEVVGNRRRRFFTSGLLRCRGQGDAGPRPRAAHGSMPTARRTFGLCAPREGAWAPSPWRGPREPG